MSGSDFAPEPARLVAKAVAGASWTAVEQTTTTALKLATLLVLARLLSPAEFGLTAAGLLIAELAFMFSEAAMGQALVQRPRLRPEHVRVAFTLMLLLGLVAAAAVAIAAPAIGRFFGMPPLERIIPVLAVLIPIQSLSSVSMALLSRQGRFRHIAMARLPSVAFGYSFVAIGLALASAGVWALVLGTICRDVLLLLALYAAARHDLRPSLDRPAIRDLAGFSTGQTLVKLANYIAQNGDYVVVGRLLGAEALGYYSRAYQLMMVPVTLMSAVTTRVLFPLMASVQEDRARLASAYLRCIGASVALTLPLSVVLAICAEEIIFVLLGQQWKAAATPFAILSLVLVFRSARNVANAATTAQGASFRLAWRQGVYALLIVLGTVLGARWGVDGVGVAVAVVIGVYYALSAQLANRLLEVSWRRFGRAHGPGIASAAVLGLVLWLSKPLISEAGNAIVELGLSLSLASAVLTVLYTFAPRQFLGTEALGIIQAIAHRVQLHPSFLRFSTTREAVGDCATPASAKLNRGVGSDRPLL
jgi:O-antigen/teichoic acid export membrane protein